MTLPLLLSVPHAGWLVPRWLRDRCQLNEDQLLADGDVGAREIFDLGSEVEAFVTTAVARAVLDMNRDPGDRARADGVVKTHTCWDESVWRSPLTSDDVARLLRLHGRYHARLASWSGRLLAGVDCHTMSDVGPPIGPDPGARRPAVCIGHAGGASCDPAWVAGLRDAFVSHFGGDVTIDEPFAGGYITRTQGLGMPWVQVELARTSSPSYAEQRRRVLAALTDWCSWLDRSGAVRRLHSGSTQTSKEDAQR